MKKLLLLTAICSFIAMTSCNNNSKTEKTHTHDDGSTHSDHDTTKPTQQEFNVADTSVKKDTGSHTHDDGSKHAH